MTISLTIASTEAHSIYSIEPSAIRSFTACKEDPFVHALINGLTAINWRKRLTRIFGSNVKDKKLRIAVRAEAIVIEACAYLSKLETIPTGLSREVERLYRLLKHFDITWIRVTDEDVAELRAWAEGCA